MDDRIRTIHKTIGILESLAREGRELTQDEWLVLGRVMAAIESFVRLRGHSLSALTGSNLLEAKK